MGKPLLATSLAALMILSLAACSHNSDGLPPLVGQARSDAASPYVIGPGDSLQVFIWRNPDLSAQVLVRPDGRITIPLIEDLEVAGKPPTEVAREIEKRLAEYVVEPKATVIMQNFVGPLDRQIRVVGEAAKPQAIPFRQDMTVLDVLIAAGGLTPFAAGNRAVIVRKVQGKGSDSYRIRLTDLIENGDMSANVEVAPGDILIIPQKWL
ncbi:MAG: polysaccharide biosynthesis/export family protein [Rhodospirillaceae bacterium]|nr:polysaccharide biosynthesis/export family protein [Rhodospirillales bacterium]